MTTAIIQGKLHKAGTSSFTDKESGEIQTWARIQVIVPDRSGDFDEIQNIKVGKDKFGWIPDYQLFVNQDINIAVDISEYKGKVNISLDNYFLGCNPDLADEHKKRQASFDQKSKVS